MQETKTGNKSKLCVPEVAGAQPGRLKATRMLQDTFRKQLPENNEQSLTTTPSKRTCANANTQAKHQTTKSEHKRRNGKIKQMMPNVPM